MSIVQRIGTRQYFNFSAAQGVQLKTFDRYFRVNASASEGGVFAAYNFYVVIFMERAPTAADVPVAADVAPPAATTHHSLFVDPTLYYRTSS